jgi:energy-coupling factor transporter ATP-binding protein EcfA2
MELVGGLLVRASQVTPRNVEFLWNGKLARGKLTLLAGAPGTGKTTMALSFAATVSSAGKWPDGAPAPRGTVVLWTTEDDYDDTIIPRLIAAGANLDNILLLGVPGAPYFNPAEHMEQLMAALDELGDVSLLIFDPVVALVTGDSHKATEVRRDLQPLVDLLKVRGIAGLGITHFAKGTQGRATLERVLGSGAWGQLARGALGTVGDFETGEFRMVVVKTTHGKPGGGFAYRIEKRSDLNDAGLWASTIVWGDALEGNADQLLAEMEGSTKLGRPSKQDPATMLIAELLKGGEPVPYADIVEAGARHDISESSLYRASKSMNIIKVKPKGRDSKGTWQMPPPC